MIAAPSFKVQAVALPETVRTRLRAALQRLGANLELVETQTPILETQAQDAVLCTFPSAAFDRCSRLRQDQRIGPLVAITQDPAAAIVARTAGADAAVHLLHLSEVAKQVTQLLALEAVRKRQGLDGPVVGDLFRAMPGMVYLADPKTFQFTYVSDRAESMLGFPRAQWTEEADFWIHHLHPDDREASVAYCRTALQELRDHQFEFRMIAQDGRIVWLRDVVQVVVEDGRVVGLHGVMLDITARKHTEQALLQSEQRWHFAVEGTGDGVWDWDATTNRVQFSHRWKEMLGYEDHEIGDRLEEWKDRVHPDDLVGVFAKLQPHLEGKVASYSSEHRLRTKDGRWKWILDRGKVLERDAEGRPLRVVGTHSDITERKRDEALREEQAAVLEMIARGAAPDATLDRLLRAFELRDDGMLCSVMVLDDEGKRLIANSAPNLPPDLVRALDGIEIGPNSTCCGAAVHHRETRIVDEIASDPLWASKREVARRCGIKASLSVPLYDAHRNPIGTFSVFHKHTGRPDASHISWITSAAQTATLCITAARAERQRISLEAQLRHAQKLEAMGTLAGGIAHDFNNILAAILGNVELARAELARGGEVQNNLDEIGKATQRATSLVRQILTFSRRQIVERQAISLKPVLEEGMRLLRATLPASVDLSLSVAADAPDVLADPTQIQQILINLGTNAWHAFEGRGGHLRLHLERVELDAEQARRHANLSAGTYALLTVNDNGKGMDQATLERVFEPFFTTKPAGQGTGLGLSVVHGIVRNHEGAILVDSSPGKGTTFRIWLPASGPAAKASNVAKTGLQQGRGERVLYLDDEPQLAEVGRRMLTLLGYSPEVFVRPADALAALREAPHRFDAIVTDFNMPIMSGVEFATAVRGIAEKMPVILSSGFMTDAVKQSARALGIQQFIAKPNTMQELGESLRASLAK